MPLFENEVHFTKGPVGRRPSSKHYRRTRIAAEVVVEGEIDDEMMDSWGRRMLPKTAKVT